jgi:multidrug transporter EmrE-like cation transporter
MAPAPVQPNRSQRPGELIKAGWESGYLQVMLTILLTVYGQLVIKWRVGEAGVFPAGTSKRASFLLQLLVDPWVLSTAIGVAAAGLLWMVALTHLELSRAYPFMASTFVLVLLLSAPLFGEPVSALKAIGVALIVGGLVVGTRG